MSRSPRDKVQTGNGHRGHYLLRLFIASDGSNSKMAVANLRRLCHKHLKGRYTIETVDVVKDFEAAVRENILVTPALILLTPGPRVTVLGNLSDSKKVLLALRLAESDS